MRLTLIEWSGKEGRFKATTLNVSRDSLIVEGKERSYRDPDKIGESAKSSRKRSRGSKLWRQDKHKFYVTRTDGKKLRVRWWTFRALDAILSHGHEIACLRNVWFAKTLRHADGTYAGSIESRGVIQTPAGYVVVGRPQWVDTLLQGWDEQPDGGSHVRASTFDVLRNTGTGSMRYQDVDVSVRYSRDRWLYSVSVNGVEQLRDVGEKQARQWAANRPAYDDTSVAWWHQVAIEDARRQFERSVSE